MTAIVVPLVGMHFRPPAKVLVEYIHAGAEVVLEPEPSNPYDEKAIKVWFWPGDILKGMRVDLAQALVGSGFVLDELVNGLALHIGFIADSDGKEGAKAGNKGNREVAELANIAGGFSELITTFSFLPNGKPAIKVETVASPEDHGDSSQ